LQLKIALINIKGSKVGIWKVCWKVCEKNTDIQSYVYYVLWLVKLAWKTKNSRSRLFPCCCALMFVLAAVNTQKTTAILLMLLECAEEDNSRVSNPLVHAAAK
jgi:hypothetical protein